MPIRRSALLLVALLLVPSGLAGCGDDDGDDDAEGTTTTEADATSSSTSTTTADTSSSTTAGGGDEEPTSSSSTPEEDGSTTSTEPPAGDGALADLLLDPATVGPGYAPDDTLGDGSLDPQLCADIALDETWDDQAAQALVSGSGADGALFQQAILQFPDVAAAEAFATQLGEGLVTCQPGTEAQPLDGIGDDAVLATAPSADTTATAGIVRVGDLVAWHLGITAPGIDPPVTEALLTATAERLAS